MRTSLIVLLLIPSLAMAQAETSQQYLARMNAFCQVQPASVRQQCYNDAYSRAQQMNRDQMQKSLQKSQQQFKEWDAKNFGGKNYNRSMNK